MIHSGDLKVIRDIEREHRGQVLILKNYYPEVGSIIPPKFQGHEKICFHFLKRFKKLTPDIRTALRVIKVLVKNEKIHIPLNLFTVQEKDNFLAFIQSI